MIDSLYIMLGKNIQRVRISKGLTQENLADKIGLSRTSIVQIENGKQKPSIDILYKIAKLFKEPVINLLPDDNIKMDRLDYPSKERIRSKKVEKEIFSLIERKNKGESNDSENSAN